MSNDASTSFVLDRYTTMGDLTQVFRRTLRSGNLLLALVLATCAGYLTFYGRPGAFTFMLIAAGTMAALFVWRGNGIGVPIMPMLAVQHLMTYGLPVITQHPDVYRYPADMVSEAGVDVFSFLGAMTLSWWLCMTAMHPSPPTAYCLKNIDREGLAGLSKLGFGLVAGATGYLLLQSLGLTGFIFSILPGGSYPIIAAATSMANACGFFLSAMIVSAGGSARWTRPVFWLLLALNCIITASGFLLSGATISLLAAMIGIIWSTGRVPKRFVLITFTALSFFNLGKFTMRERYWHIEESERVTRDFGLLEMPATYAEWAEASWIALIGGEKEDPSVASFKDEKKKESQSIVERLNNLQNLLYVIDAMEEGNTPPLGGSTYTLIPPLLIPRILWPDKPRSHEGQVLLNTHFGRQDLAGTFMTYIAWGLLPEAHGNFGAIFGALALGAALGVFAAYIENVTARKPVLSAEGFMAFALFLGLANSFEMVSSVMVTSIFQAVMLIGASCLPFVKRQSVGPRPAAA